MCSAASWIKEWQDLIAGIIGFGGAIAAIFYTSLSERRKRTADAKALRQSIGVELRRMSDDALRSYTLLKNARDRENAISMMDEPGGRQRVMNSVKIARPIIYPNVAAQIVSMGKNARRVVYFYSQLAMCTDLVARIQSVGSNWDSREEDTQEVLHLLRKALKAGQDARLHLEAIHEDVTDVDKRFADRLQKELGTD